MNSSKPQLNADAIRSARWFKQKGSEITSIKLADSTAGLENCSAGFFMVSFADHSPELYFVVTDEKGAALRDVDDPAFLKCFFEGFSRSAPVKTRGGEITFERFGDFDLPFERAKFSLLPCGSSNSLVVCSEDGKEKFIVKFMRHLLPGENVEEGVNRRLVQAGVEIAPRLRATAVYTAGNGKRYHLAALFDFVPNKGSAWDWTAEWLKGYIRRRMSDYMALDCYTDEAFNEYRRHISILGGALASLHAALAKGDAPAFGVLPIEKKDIELWHEGWMKQFEKTFAFLERSKLWGEKLVKVLAAKKAIQALLDGAPHTFAKLGHKIRQHGDFHLGQVLVGEGRFYIIDFEGEPLKPYSERAIHYPALKDVAGMLRSFSYAAFSAYFIARGLQDKRGVMDGVMAACHRFEMAASEAFLNGYYARLKELKAEFLPLEEPAVLSKALAVLMMDKALYEVEYEINNRPDWLEIPMSGILDVLEGVS